MAVEIERKFLVADDTWRTGVSGARRIRQAYLCKNGMASVRVRVVDDCSARLTVKAMPHGDGPALSRAEFEYAIPLEEGLAMLDLRIGRVVEKTRHLVPAENGRTWEVDVFSGTHEGLVLAEIELSAPDEEFVQPRWLGREVTDDPAYSNAALAQRD
ncbi:CYTH domain-containing protein [Novosphingobium malaysiense]|uniref:Adenylate cyclase n=1 Tax=Novosphingobium malaysiense TaxID=1348853 RepID=A0A0B1ZK38_9SPHN|nr:CYTH domain-containing protein [Novosphingobium malaysiense]KHK89536.1 adenylate cyclase [Novosphingobium malaysiense]